MKKQKLLAFTSALVLSFSMFFTAWAPQVHAVAHDCTWTGASSNNFNTAGNWSGCNSAAPQTDDNLIFNMSTISADTTLTNDISSLSVGTITFTGTSSYKYTLTGNGITVTSGISDSRGNILDLDVTLGADITVTQPSGSSGTSFGKYGGTVRTLNTNGHTAAFTGSGASCGVNMWAKLAGSGALSSALSGSGIGFKTDATSFTGAISATAGILDATSPGVFGTTSGVTVSSAGSLALSMNDADRTYTFPVTLSGSGTVALGATLYVTNTSSVIGCGGGNMSTMHTATLSGAFTLNSNIVYVGSYGNANVTGTYASNGHTISAKSGSVGSITTPDGTVAAPVETITINAGDDQPDLDVNIGFNQTYIINGIRRYVVLNTGGVLMGTGKIDDLNVLGTGRVKPGQSPGCLSTNNISFDGGYYDAELGGTTACSGYDQLKVTGTVILHSLSTPSSTPATLNTTIYGTFKPAKGNVFKIIDNDGADAVEGTFKDLAEGATFEVAGNVFKISYVGGDGNDVTLTVLSIASPDTGFTIIKANPLISLVATTIFSLGILGIARRYRSVSGR